jgi:hypothetical protein
MTLRWTAAGMLEVTKGFRRFKAHEHLPVLRAALVAHQSKYVTQQVNTTLTPHSITHGDACFAYFNKIRDIPSVARADVDLFAGSIYVVGVLLEHLLKKIVFYHRYNEFTDQLAHAHTPELRLER